MRENMAALLAEISGFVWGLPLILLLVGTGIFLTIRLRGLQVRQLGRALRIAFSREDTRAAGDISHFKALMTALAATVGIGNIAGVATAIAAGGPGAVFWMWMTAFFGMATKYSEAILAVKYRVVDKNGDMSGGPMYYLERGLGIKWLGVLFALFGSLAAFGIGNMAQANTVAHALESSFNVRPEVTGLVMAALTAAVILGGIKRIGNVAGVLVPVMAVIYIVAGIVVLFLNYQAVPGALALILEHAFTPTAATGGFAGAIVMQTIKMGVSRGLFSNESGLGSAPIVAAAARTRNPFRQALVSMTGTFIDTIIVCTITGLVIVSTGTWKSGQTGAELTVAAFSSGLPGDSGGVIIAVATVLFAYSTILGWAYYGEKCCEYLLGIRAVLTYRYLWVIAVFCGALMKLRMVWDFADIMNGLMAIPNLIGLIGLSGVIVAETRRYLAEET
ncbi:MAG: sodium:alanine symporter family protein [Gammaproteobacteria bacterium]